MQQRPETTQLLLHSFTPSSLFSIVVEQSSTCFFPLFLPAPPRFAFLQIHFAHRLSKEYLTAQWPRHPLLLTLIHATSAKSSFLVNLGRLKMKNFGLLDHQAREFDNGLQK